MNAPLVTVIVPGWNVAPFADEALSSLVTQTLTEWTAVLIDDGSTDDTAAVFDGWAERDGRFRVIRNDAQRGLGAARNVGLDAVDTPFLTFFDPDDILLPDALQRLLAVLEETGSDFATSGYVRLVADADGVYTPQPMQDWVRRATTPALRSATLLEHPEATGNIVAWSKVSRTDFWERASLRFPEGRLYEDQIVAQQMYTRARRFDVDPGVLVHWRVRHDGSSITQGEARIEVLRERLAETAAGLRVLDESGYPAAATARVGQLLRMDVSRLADSAREHPDAAYRRALGAFVRDLLERPDRPDIDEATARLVTAVALW